jgi:hypothetical protein
MLTKKILLSYLAGYLLAGGIGFAFAPEITLQLFFSTGEYGDIMPRVTGMFMMALSGLLWTMIRRGDYSYYRYSVAARTFIVAFMFYLYGSSKDPMFMILIGIVLAGLIPSYWILFRNRSV